MSATRLIDVCVCTYRRNSVVDTICSIAAQRLPGGTPPAYRGRRQRRTTVSGRYRTKAMCGARSRSSLRPCAGTQHFRCPNAALDAATAPLVAFIDDDEVATPGWLAGLLECHARTGATIVFGPVQAIYGERPAWLRKADLHSIRPVFRAGQYL